MKVLITSKNPVKIKAVEKAFNNLFNKSFSFTSIDLNDFSINLISQPLNETETRKTCEERIKQIIKIKKGFDFYVSIEGGINYKKTGLNTIVIFTAIAYKDNTPTVIKGCEVPLPIVWINLLKEDKSLELGDVIDEYLGEKDLKKRGGAVGILTNNHIKRFDLLYQACCCALIPYTNPNLF